MMLLVFLLILLEIPEYKKLFLIAFPSHSTSFLQEVSFITSLIDFGPSWHVELACPNAVMHLVNVQQIPTLRLHIFLGEASGQALIACWAGQCDLLSPCKNGHSSTMESSVWVFFQLQAVPQVG